MKYKLWRFLRRDSGPCNMGGIQFCLPVWEQIYPIYLVLGSLTWRTVIVVICEGGKNARACFQIYAYGIDENILYPKSQDTLILFMIKKPAVIKFKLKTHTLIKNNSTGMQSSQKTSYEVKLDIINYYFFKWNVWWKVNWLMSVVEFK